MKPIPKPSSLSSQKFSTADIGRDFAGVPTPAYVIDEEFLETNLAYLAAVGEAAGAKIILAQKSYSFYPTYPLIGRYLCGSTASGIYEARLAYEEMGGEVHCFSAAYADAEMEELLPIVDYLYFNSFRQWRKFKPAVAEENRRRETADKAPVRLLLRVNPEHSEGDVAIYDPAGAHSRLGIILKAFRQGVGEYGLEGIDGLHFHTLCEHNADALARTLAAFEEHFGPYLESMTVVNFGGGHHITRADYDVDLLIETIGQFRERHPRLTVYLEPGEAISLNCGWLVSEVMDIVENDGKIALLNTSAVCHMPDVLEMPYLPRCFIADPACAADGAYIEAEAADIAAGGENVYRLGGPTCLAGDIIGDYRFPRELRIGDRVVFCDMALYAHVKTNTFNGMPLPHLVLRRAGNRRELIRRARYEDFKDRLGPSLIP